MHRLVMVSSWDAGHELICCLADAVKKSGGVCSCRHTGLPPAAVRGD